MKVFTRYLLRAHIGPFLFAFVALTGVILINTLARQLAELAGKGLPMDVILHFFVLSLPSNIALTLPMAVLVAVLYTFSQLASENEISALRASGIDLRRMVAPLVVAAMLVAGGMSWFNSFVLPESNHEWKQLMVDIGRTSPLLTLREQSVNEIRADGGRAKYYLQATRIDPPTNRLWDVVIYDRSQGGIGRTIYADSGRMNFNPAQTDLLLTLYDGHINEINFNQLQEFQQLGFGEQVIRMEGVGTELERQEGAGYRSDREMTVPMLNERVAQLRDRHRNIREEAARDAVADVEARLAGRAAIPDPDAVDRDEVADPPPSAERTARLLRSHESRLNSTERQIRQYRVEVHKKFAIATAPLVFVLLGAPLAIRFPGGGVGVVIAASLGVFALYYVGLIGGETLAAEGYLDPAVSMWAMNVLLLVPGIWLFSRMGRETHTARSGSRLGSLLDLVRRRRKDGE